ncbi:hypothetical protein AERO8C_140113 [Aeromonas veronii]|uniref:Uncharacterized protein n=1 Tax=Aeromonas veronii TaxID=654 RepID=A0A653KV13_AERVE|nr:hypothetical protein AERO8C_140113 [Aeromonas veronii]
MLLLFDMVETALQFSQLFSEGRDIIFIFLQALVKAPAAIGAIDGCPDPEERPQHMQGEETDPAGNMDGILMGMIAMFGDFVRNIVDHDDSVEDDQRDKDEQAKGKVIKEHV